MALRSALIAYLALASAALSNPASAYVRSESRGAPIRWPSPLVVIRLHDPGPTSGFTLPELEREVKAAVDSWLSPCTAFRVELATSSRRKGLAGEDGENAVATRSRSWCPDAATHQRQCYDPRLEARTVVRFVDGPLRNGERHIAEVDLEINAVDYRWYGGIADRRAEGLTSLRSVLVHELGHVFGLTHDCGVGEALFGASAARRRLPSCATTRDLGTAMYPGPGEAGRKLVFEPAQSERRALCELYPAKTSNCGCSAGSETGASMLSLLVVPLAIGLRRSAQFRKEW